MGKWESEPCDTVTQTELVLSAVRFAFIHSLKNGHVASNDREDPVLVISV